MLEGPHEVCKLRTLGRVTKYELIFQIKNREFKRLYFATLAFFMRFEEILIRYKPQEGKIF